MISTIKKTQIECPKCSVNMNSIMSSHYVTEDCDLCRDNMAHEDFHLDMETELNFTEEKQKERLFQRMTKLRIRMKAFHNKWHSLA